ncbi:MAG TPA: non-homologous end-joining DNA ligase [Saprospiraceae bacterium]|nr:non-homologous end-joining DNA ligase [Saprospiraceae bacterium]HNT19313.1 non-homologous end-joining DNA ligase [Saprospiraceae bacterium]
MAKSTFHNTRVGKRILKLSNLEKAIYKQEGILKAEVIQYYLQVAPTLLKYIRGRPLSLIRYPDGIEGEAFYQKNRPDWTPEWIDSIELGKEKKNYLLAEEEATLVWIANLAGLELHMATCKKPEYNKPDLLVFDLDPPEEGWWDKTKGIALALRQFLSRYDYTAFVKTSGNKGLHLFVPIEPDHPYEVVIEVLKNLTREFAALHPDLCTLNIRKNQRTDKLFIDIQRNHASQTIIAPYSLRGKPGAPVSMPVDWNALDQLESAKAWSIHNAMEQISRHGDAWDGFYSLAVKLHPFRPVQAKPRAHNPEGSKHKSPEQLARYKQKRDFAKSPEPAVSDADEYTSPNAFVIHRHHASRLHYDLRLQLDGVLRCWAVPRGMPDQPGIKRMAVETEPHPVQYLTFEGIIPKGEYGGGAMWIFARGRFEITKQKKDGFYFRLYSPELEGEFRMHNLKEKEWLLERVDRAQWDRNTYIPPMLASAAQDLPVAEHQFQYEIKWDGIRVGLQIQEDGLKIFSRSGRDITAQFPEISQAREHLNANVAVLDAEIVCLDGQGKPVFKDVISRMHAGQMAIEALRKQKPACCYLFDVMYLDGRPLLKEPLLRRQEWLKDILKVKNTYRISDVFADGRQLKMAAERLGLEGIMAKKKDSLYTPGRRSTDWIKIKFRNTMDCYIVGFTAGKGDREPLFGALQLLSRNEDGSWVYRGRVGTGFDSALMKTIRKEILEPSRVHKKPVGLTMEEEKNTTWVEPEHICEIQYASITSNKTLREPVFIQLKPDLE